MLNEGVKAAKIKFQAFHHSNIYDLVDEVKQWLLNKDITILDISFLHYQDDTVAAVITFTTKGIR